MVNILYAIKGTIEAHMCRCDEGHFDNEKDALKHAHEIIQRIYLQVERAMLITKKIGFAMKMASKADEPLTPVSVKESWDQVVAIMEKQYHLNGSLEILSHVPDDFPNVLCKQKELTEILYILADNAIQAMKRNGKLIIRTSLAFKAGEDPIANIVIADTGPGIPEDTLSRLFEPFMTTKPMGEGNGLGLCIVKGLVRKNGGNISVSSFQGCGTTFTLSFSVAKTGKREEKRHLALS